MNFIKIENPYYSGEVGTLKQVDIETGRGVFGLYCDETGKIKTFLFDENIWTEKEAEEYVAQVSVDTSKAETTATIKRTEKGMLAIASDETVDRDGEVISIDGWELENFKANPVLLWAHNRSMAHDGRPIGTVTNIKFRQIDGKKRLTFTPEFDDTTEFNAQTKKMVEKGLLNTFSVAFLPKERHDNVYTKQELLEISLVPVPSNSSAVFIQRSKGFGIDEEVSKQFIEKKNIVAFRAYQPAPESMQFDSNAAQSRVRAWAGGPSKGDMDLSKYKEAFVCLDSEDPQNLKLYKLLHHDVQGGDLITNWKGVISAMAALLGARGGVNLTGAERRKAYDHLVEHYKQFDKVAPDYRLVETQELKEIFDTESENTKKKAFVEFRKIMRDTKKMVNEIKNNKKLEEKRSDNFDSKLTQVLGLLKAMGENIAEPLKGETNRGKEEK